MRPIRVLHVSYIETPNYFLNNLFDHTDRSDVIYSSVTLAKRAGFVEELEARGVTAYALNATSRSQYPRAVRQIRKIIQQENIDIVHTHMFDPTLVGLVAAKSCGRKVVVTRHHSDAMHAIPNQLKRRFYLGIENCVNKYSNHIIVLSRVSLDIVTNLEKVPREKVSLIPNAQTADRFRCITPAVTQRIREELGVGDHLALVCVSRLYHRKGHVYLFEALAPLIRSGLKANLYLVGVGSKEYRQELEKLAQQLGIHQQVKFLGWRDDVLEVISVADILVHPSLEDALSSTLIEALMLGKPIIASDISGARDSLDDGRYGVIVPPADANAFRSALEMVVANLDAFREKAQGGSQYILDQMGAPKVAEQHIACYQKVLGRA